MEQTRNSPNCIGIIGLGLIGGSLGLDLQSLGFQVHGIVHKSITAEKAKTRQLANFISTDFKTLAKCDLIILALPIEQLLKPSQELINALPKSAVITDVGSVKEPILKVWSKLHPNFVASHPMAGTTESGVEAGRTKLFKNRPWIATPNQKTNPTALKKVEELAISLGCKWITAEAEVHDQAVALISHLPVLISAVLLKTLESENDQSVLYLAKALASSGFADTTRVGGGNPTLGTAMMANNSNAILRTLKSYNEKIKQFEKDIVNKNWEKIQAELEQTKSTRQDIYNN